MQKRTGRSEEPARAVGMESKTGRREPETRTHQEKKADGCARRRQLVRDERVHQRSRSRRGYAVATPSEVAKPAGIPNNLIVTCPPVSERALRVSRFSQERRACALRT